MKVELHKYAMDWVTGAGRELIGITTDEVMQTVNDNLDGCEPITLDDADMIRRIIEEELNK